MRWRWLSGPARRSSRQRTSSPSRRSSSSTRSRTPRRSWRSSRTSSRTSRRRTSRARNSSSRRAKRRPRGAEALTSRAMRAGKHLAGALTAFALIVPSATADPLVRQATGPGSSDIQATVEQFRADLGAQRREITWDDATDAQADPNVLPRDYLEAHGLFSMELGFREFRVSATAASGRAPKFAAFNSAYAAQLQAFSGERVFARMDRQSYVFGFLMPGTATAATVRGVGVVFSDVDEADDAALVLYDKQGAELARQVVPVTDGGLSFVGISFPDAVVA